MVNITSKYFKGSTGNKSIQHLIDLICQLVLSFEQLIDWLIENFIKVSFMDQYKIVLPPVTLYT